jgi:hypothetical protein
MYLACYASPMLGEFYFGMGRCRSYYSILFSFWVKLCLGFCYLFNGQRSYFAQRWALFILCSIKYIVTCWVYVMRQITSCCLGSSEFIPHSFLHSHNLQFHSYCHLQCHNYFSCCSHCHSLDTTQQLITAGLHLISSKTGNRLLMLN